MFNSNTDQSISKAPLSCRLLGRHLLGGFLSANGMSVFGPAHVSKLSGGQMRLNREGKRCGLMAA